MILPAWNFPGFGSKSLGLGNRSASVEAILEPASPSAEAILELAPPCRAPAIAYRRRAYLEPAPPQPSAREHAELLLEWIRVNVDVADGPITHAAILEFYTEMLIEAGLKERAWNSVACEFRRLTTGRRKVYAWIETTTGAVHRLRIYPIPRRAAGAMANRKDSAQQRSAA